MNLSKFKSQPKGSFRSRNNSVISKDVNALYTYVQNNHVIKNQVHVKHTDDDLKNLLVEVSPDSGLYEGGTYEFKVG